MIIMNNKKRGFTLIEMMIVVATVAIVAAIAMPLYTEKVKRGRRVDAVNALLSISLAEERYRSTHSTYGTLAQVWGGVTTSQEGYYTLAISNVSATAYTVTATGTGTQASDSDSSGTSCATLTLTMSSGTITKSPAICWPT